MLAGWDVLTTLCAFVKWERKCRKYHKSLPSFHIPDDFFGVNVATSEDQRCDDYIIARLSELGIKNVRLAFSYGSFDGPAGRFLGKLLEKRFVVTLVVLPPLLEAKKMLKDPLAQEKWGRFIAEVFNCYASRVAVFEIGCTPNRKKWSGFKLRGYLQAWRIAHQIAKPHGVTLGGPNVQDFESYHNAILLFSMRRMASVPEIHTDNLFVERVIEPEAYDHRVAGYLMSFVLKLNLIKKARILKFLGKKAGCSKTFSTCSFWSTKRLYRWSVFPHVKNVDYLVRYLVLAASSGALDRVYWGPLICWRDGLINDGNRDYPDVDHSSFYQRVRGCVENFSIYPAFFALGYFSRRLRNASCDQARHKVNGLSHFAFTGGNNDVFHVCWCRDGQVFKLTDIYSDEELAAAVFSDACGSPVNSQLVVNEHPLVIDFPELKSQKLPKSLPKKSECHSHIVYASQPGLQSVPWEDQHWRGAFSITGNLSSLSLGDILKPQIMASRPEVPGPQVGPDRSWNIANPLNPGQQLTVKLNRPGWIRRLVYPFKPSEGRRHWNTALGMLKKGICMPAPIAFYERRQCSGGRESYFIFEHIPDTFSALEVCGAFNQGLNKFLGIDKNEWFDVLAGFIFKTHNFGISHGNFGFGNLMFKQENGGSIKSYLIDIGRSKVAVKRLKGPARMRDIMRICHALDWPDRRLFINSYSRHSGRKMPSLWRLALRYYDLKQGSKKYFKEKFFKKPK